MVDGTLIEFIIVFTMEKKKNRNEENFPKLCMNKDNQV
jgi:hypothetical protein